MKLINSNVHTCTMLRTLRPAIGKWVLCLPVLMQLLSPTIWTCQKWGKRCIFRTIYQTGLCAGIYSFIVFLYEREKIDTISLNILWQRYVIVTLFHYICYERYVYNRGTISSLQLLSWNFNLYWIWICKVKVYTYPSSIVIKWVYFTSVAFQLSNWVWNMKWKTSKYIVVSIHYSVLYCFSGEVGAWYERQYDNMTLQVKEILGAKVSGVAIVLHLI